MGSDQAPEELMSCDLLVYVVRSATAYLSQCRRHVVYVSVLQCRPPPFWEHRSTNASAGVSPSRHI